MTFPRLILRNLAYHWRGNLAVLLGVAVGSAVLTGALLVGDSLRGSLRARAERQLGWVDAAALFPRPIRAAIADGLPAGTAPVLMLPGSIQKVDEDDPIGAPYIGHVMVLGVDRRFRLASEVDWDAAPGRRGPLPVVLPARVAERLEVKPGDHVRLGVESFSDIPRASLLARRALDDVTRRLDCTVAAVLPADAPENDFNLTPNPAAPLNVFVPLKLLSAALERPPPRSARNQPPPPTRANALLAPAGTPVDQLNAVLKSRLQLEDWGLSVRPARWNQYVAVQSDQLVMDDATTSAIEAATHELGLRSEPTLVYLVNSIAHDGREIPYSVVAAVNPAAAPPLGPFRTTDGRVPGDGEIVLAAWDESPLRDLPDGAKLTLTYFNPEVEGEGKLETHTLTFRGYVPLRPRYFGPLAIPGLYPSDDPDLTPSVRGLTDEATTTMKAWDPPRPLDREKILQATRSQIHEDYWQTYRATPKAYVNLATGKKLFGSRYGSVTSVRVAPAPGETAAQTAARLRPAILEHLDPATAGLRFEPVRERLLAASHGGTDFGGLFLAFSMFLIAAALMLVGLLFRLALDRRATEIGLLLAVGFAVRHVRRLLLVEGFIIAVIGTGLGLLAAVEYNKLLLNVLLNLWPDREVATFLKPHVSPTSFAIGSVLTELMCLGTLWLSIRGLVKVTPPALLRGETAVATTFREGSRYGRFVILAAVPLGIAAIIAGRFVGNPDYQAMTFFAGGGLLLTAGLTALWVWMKRTRHHVVSGRGVPALARLGARNAARNPGRSLLTAALLASAAFLLVAVESFRRQPGAGFLDQNGGSGGFNLVAEADVPLFQPFDQGPGRKEVEQRLQRAYGGTSTDPHFLAAKAALDTGLEAVFPLRLRSGDDASCMNLFRATRPRILGVPDSLIGRGGFKFYETEASTPEEKANPWLLLTRELPDGAIPVFAENNTAVWMLKTGVGGEVKVPDDAGGELRLRIVGTLTDSPFQSELLMSESNFTRVFPKEGGYRVFLIRTPPDQQAAVTRALVAGLRANGLVVTPTREKVGRYQEVIGAYLSTFQLLGGFGLLLGVLGLAVVVLRGVWERLGELALLRAMGYRTRSLQFLVLAENALLLAVGLGVGVVAALASVAPHVAEGATVPWLGLGAMLGLVLLVGLGVASAATAGILRVPVIPALRRE